MPDYCFKCDECGRTVTEFRLMADSGLLKDCITERPSSDQVDVCYGTMRRDFRSEASGGSLDGDREIVSENAGLMPHQFAEANKLYAGIAHFDDQGMHCKVKDMDRALDIRGFKKGDSARLNRGTATKIYRRDPVTGMYAWFKKHPETGILERI